MEEKKTSPKKALRKSYHIGGQKYEKGTPYSKDLEDKIKAQGGHADKCFK
jgi:hypothetical protein